MVDQVEWQESKGNRAGAEELEQSWHRNQGETHTYVTLPAVNGVWTQREWYFASYHAVSLSPAAQFEIYIMFGVVKVQFLPTSGEFGNLGCLRLGMFHFTRSCSGVQPFSGGFVGALSLGHVCKSINWVGSKPLQVIFNIFYSLKLCMFL
jgi:hypothetical protein